jgi:transcription initiation factor TFIID subunit 1, fungi type
LSKLVKIMSRKWVCSLRLHNWNSDIIFLAAEAENRPKSAHRYNVAEQQQIYKSEIERIWKAQFDSLSRKDEPQLTAEDEEQPEIKGPPRQSSVRKESVAPYSSAMSPVAVGAPSPAFSRGSSLERDRETSVGPDGAKKVLRIKRLVRYLPVTLPTALKFRFQTD